ncbi:hypothetical protein [Legionella brunensis]|uniref:Uncharacterized protein n=1 Tax=Legionella brunensis TaxID=29422 RepID=A0A0W0SKE7_9GAMM|nr:hypothetical protein [Legionella brunensis]KTC83732.1 hypothetical protein Lbru_1701 [Legionella brunensis]
MFSHASDVLKIFENTFNELNNEFECGYISYMYQYNSYKLAFVTHSEWMDLYINNGLNKDCSLIRVGLEKISLSKSKNVILRWNDVQSITNKEKDTAGIRGEFNICNGISFGRKILGASDYFGLAADFHYFDFPRNILSNSKRIRKIMDDLFRASTLKLFYDSILSTNTINPKLLPLVIDNICLPFRNF